MEAQLCSSRCYMPTRESKHVARRFSSPRWRITGADPPRACVGDGWGGMGWGGEGENKDAELLRTQFALRSRARARRNAIAMAIRGEANKSNGKAHRR